MPNNILDINDDCKSLDDVVHELELIMLYSTQTNDRIGYFAALYHKVTCRVRDGVANGEFQNGPRMALLDVTFANRYLHALKCWVNKQPISDSWRVALETTKKPTKLVIQ